MPLFHVHGLLAGFLAPLSSGGSVIVPSRFSASEFWDNFIAYKANWYTAVPTIHQILLRNPVRVVQDIILQSLLLRLDWHDVFWGEKDRFAPSLLPNSVSRSRLLFSKAAC